MTTKSEQEAYMLYHRRDQIEEEQRLDAQHEIVKHAIFGGRLLLPSIPSHECRSAVADVACGTGVWLNDLARTHFADTLHSDPPLLVGFDVNAKAFSKSLEPGVQLIQHDCTRPFNERYHNRFDLVNMRALAYAVPEEGFYQLIGNVLQILRPGGYIQWGESESKLWKAIPGNGENPSNDEQRDLAMIQRSLAIVSEERSARGLVSYLPHFMVRSLMRLPLLQSPSVLAQDRDPVSIIHFELQPGGASVTGLDSKWVDAFTILTLEALKHLLTAASLRKKDSMEKTGFQEGVNKSQQDLGGEIERVQTCITELILGSTVKMGGVFPVLVARKARLHL